MKPRLVHNWPDVKEENDQLSSRILDLANDYSKELNERKKHKHDNDEKNNFERPRHVHNREKVTELKPVMTEEENFGI